jgi:20S proteasome alpha/beta subunit
MAKKVDKNYKLTEAERTAKKTLVEVVDGEFYVKKNNEAVVITRGKKKITIK